MLILPLHRPLTRATFPFVTALLIVANVLVFFGWQGGDEAAMASARQHYLHSELARHEVPAYGRYLARTNQVDALNELDAMPEDVRADYVADLTLTDVGFVAALESGDLFHSTGELETWRPLRAQYDALLGEVFTLRHLLRSSEVDPWRMLASAFLHGGVMHLIGNMLFLLALGLLVEGAVGSGRFLGVYLLGAFGSSAASLLWRWGEAGGGLGASGAIAALMGAFCVIWGRQPVRFFYWVGVVFDYVRAPAIWLLPLWLGWEVYNLLANDDLGIGFDAHAGGIVSGALMGAALVRFGQVRDGFILDTGDQPRDDRWERAQACLGRMQLAEAERLLEELVREQPDRFDLRLALYRVARNGQRRDATTARGLGLLELDVVDPEQVQAQRGVLAELDEAGIEVASARRLELARRWLRSGALDSAEEVLKGAGHGDEQELAQLRFQLALGWRDRHDHAAHQKALRTLVERHPDQPQAEKARFLLAALESEPLVNAHSPAR